MFWSGDVFPAQPDKPDSNIYTMLLQCSSSKSALFASSTIWSWILRGLENSWHSVCTPAIYPAPEHSSNLRNILPWSLSIAYCHLNNVASPELPNWQLILTWQSAALCSPELTGLECCCHPWIYLFQQNCIWGHEN